jgi:tetratricopeptide (TPR) repeat protein
VLGRVWLAWPVFGRFRADSILRRAAELAPADPAPFYYRALVGLRLGGDDGESVARRALVHVIALDPHYADAWTLWQTLYRDEGARATMVRTLALHAGDRDADLWRAGLLVELRRYGRAEPLLDSLVSAEPDDPAPRAWLARGLYEQGRDGAAAPVYAAALRRAEDDTGSLLWRQVRSIASPLEGNRYAELSPEERPAFLRLFWARRDPDLRDSLNARIGEHFRRLVEARRHYALLHPLSRWNHSRLWRTLQGGLATPTAERPGYDAVRTDIAGARAPRLADQAVAAGLAPRLDDSTAQTANLEDGLDDRGRILVRYGEPQVRHVWSLDAETWAYDLPQGDFQVTFLRRTEDGGGDEVVTPVVAGEAAAARYLLTTDRPDEMATLRFSFWLAAFRHGDGDSTELVLFPDSVRALAALFDAAGQETARDSAAPHGVVHLTASPGSYLLALDGSRAGQRGLYRGTQTVPAFPPDALTVSSLLVASGDVPADRRALEAAAPAGLRLPVRRPLRLYAEVYGLADSAGVAHYDAAYRFERTTRGLFGGVVHHHVTTIAFRRQLAASSRAVESLVVDPGQLPRGHYRLVLDVRDGVSGARAASGTLEFDLH